MVSEFGWVDSKVLGAMVVFEFYSSGNWKMDSPRYLVDHSI